MQENILFDENNTKDKIYNLQMSMKTVLNQYNDFIKSKTELKETEEILN